MNYRDVLDRYQSLTTPARLAGFFAHKAEVRAVIMDMKRLLKQFEAYRTDQLVRNAIESKASSDQTPRTLQEQIIRARETKQVTEVLRDEAAAVIGQLSDDKNSAPKFAKPDDPQNMRHHVSSNVQYTLALASS
ncbi:hypothetical protein FRC02_002766 [Tulasnella sp. 418]|nr:hypothetical protein FRC02_002766 [Tulasnella sp. 418]